MSTRAEILLQLVMLALSLGALFGLAIYLGYRAGFAKARDTQRAAVGAIWRELMEAKFAPRDGQDSIGE